MEILGLNNFSAFLVDFEEEVLQVFAAIAVSEGLLYSLFTDCLGIWTYLNEKALESLPIGDTNGTSAAVGTTWTSSVHFE